MNFRDLDHEQFRRIVDEVAQGENTEIFEQIFDANVGHNLSIPGSYAAQSHFHRGLGSEPPFLYNAPVDTSTYAALPVSHPTLLHANDFNIFQSQYNMSNNQQLTLLHPPLRQPGTMSEAGNRTSAEAPTSMPIRSSPTMREASIITTPGPFADNDNFEWHGEKPTCPDCPKHTAFVPTSYNRGIRCNKHTKKAMKEVAASTSPVYVLPPEMHTTNWAEAHGMVYPILPPLNLRDDDHERFVNAENEWVAKFLSAANCAYTEGSRQNRKDLTADENDRIHTDRLRQQLIYNHKPHEESSKAFYTLDWVVTRFRFLFRAVLTHHRGGQQVYPVGGSNNGYGEDRTMKMSERLDRIREHLTVNKRVVMDVIEGRGVCALATNPEMYANRKDSNNKCNTKKKRKLEQAGEVIASVEGEEDDKDIDTPPAIFMKSARKSRRPRRPPQKLRETTSPSAASGGTPAKSQAEALRPHAISPVNSHNLSSVRALHNFSGSPLTTSRPEQLPYRTSDSLSNQQQAEAVERVTRAIAMRHDAGATTHFRNGNPASNGPNVTVSVTRETLGHVAQSTSVSDASTQPGSEPAGEQPLTGTAATIVRPEPGVEGQSVIPAEIFGGYQSYTYSADMSWPEDSDWNFD